MGVWIGSRARNTSLSSRAGPTPCEVWATVTCRRCAEARQRCDERGKSPCQCVCSAEPRVFHDIQSVPGRCCRGRVPEFASARGAADCRPHRAEPPGAQPEQRIPTRSQRCAAIPRFLRTAQPRKGGTKIETETTGGDEAPGGKHFTECARLGSRAADVSFGVRDVTQQRAHHLWMHTLSGRHAGASVTVRTHYIPVIRPPHPPTLTPLWNLAGAVRRKQDRCD